MGRGFEADSDCSAYEEVVRLIGELVRVCDSHRKRVNEADGRGYVSTGGCEVTTLIGKGFMKADRRGCMRLIGG
eukprot:1514238-Rhodomonas_salina.1